MRGDDGEWCVYDERRRRWVESNLFREREREDVATTLLAAAVLLLSALALGIGRLAG